MSRELKRVPLDFDWPLNETWKGYLNPHGDECITCKECEGSGASKHARYLTEVWYGHVPFKPEDRGSTPFLPEMPEIQAMAVSHVKHAPDYYGIGDANIHREAVRLCQLFNSQWSHHLNQRDVDVLLKADKLWDFTRRPITRLQRAYVRRRVESGLANSWYPLGNGYRPTAREVNLWSIHGFGHGGNSWCVIEAECKRLGKPYLCGVCGGEGSKWTSEEARLTYENWKKEEPPKGDGYQVWESVSEGSPISPVFMTPEGLATWMADHWAKDGNHDQWLAFITGPGWAPSMVSDGSRVMSGVQAGAECADEEEERPKLSVLDQAAIMGLPLLNCRKRTRKWVRQKRKGEFWKERLCR